MVTNNGECTFQIRFYGSLKGHYKIDYDCGDGKYYPLYLKEGFYNVGADVGYGHVVGIKFSMGKYAQELGILDWLTKDN